MADIQSAVFVHGRKHTRLVLLLLISVSFAIAGCTPDGGGIEPTPTMTGATEVEPTGTPTAAPTPTATVLPQRALLIVPPETEPWLVSQLEGPVSELAAASGLAIEQMSELNSETITENTKMVIALPTVSDLAGLANANPETAFIAVGHSGVSPGPNLSVIGPQGFRADQQGFLAGNLAAMQTEDWRVGVISIGETIDGQAGRNGFLNGAIFFCGLCRPAFPPFVLYPTYSDVPAGGDAAAWQAATESLLGEAVKTVYLYPGADNPELRESLLEAGFLLITGPSGEPGIQPNVISRIVPDPATGIQLLWREMLAGNPGQTLPMPISVQDANPNLLSAGRLVQLNNLIEDLMNGVVDTGIDPLTAEPR